MRLAARARGIQPFYVMEMAKEAEAIASQDGSDQPMIYLNVGEPDFAAPALVQEAAQRALVDGKTHYTHSAGLPLLRERISTWYEERFGLKIPARRILITAGASAALHMLCLALIENGDHILMPDPGYPCNRQFVSMAGGQSIMLPTTAADRFQLSAAQVRQAWTPQTRGVLLASPSNPTGTSIQPQALQAIHQEASRRDGVTLVDEIYLGLSYDDNFGQSALALDEHIISINSFSKYFGMTGWRLGWLVAPDALMPTLEQMAQHLFICPSSIAQYAALACFEAESIREYEQRRTQFKARRDKFVPQLQALGMHIPVMPDGAFYVWADCLDFCRQLLPDAPKAGSWELAFELMRRAHVAATPGRDFSQFEGRRYMRFSTANSMAHLQEAIERMQNLLS